MSANAWLIARRHRTLKAQKGLAQRGIFVDVDVLTVSSAQHAVQLSVPCKPWK
jgi:hypothetical protein